MKIHGKSSRLKRSFAVVIAFALIMVSVLPSSLAQAATKKVASTSVNFSVKDKTGVLKVLIIGKKYTAQSTLAPKASTDKVTYSSSNTKNATVGKTTGIIVPKKSGRVTITAKTESGKKKSVQYLITNTAGTTKLQTSVNDMLKAANVGKISIVNLAEEASYKINKGDYSKKSLSVNAPKSDVSNYGIFKNISLLNVKNGTWTEFASGNSFKVTDKELKFVVDKAAAVKDIIFSAVGAIVNLQSAGTVDQVQVTGANAKVSVKADGNVKKIVIDSKSDVSVEGTADKVTIEVTKNAEGSKIESSVPVDAKVGSKVSIDLKSGAEGSKIEAADKTVMPTVTNNTKSTVDVGSKDSTDKVTVNPGQNVDTGKPSTDTGNGGGNSGGGTPPTSGETVKTITGASSAGGKTATYTLTQDIDMLKSAQVKVTIPGSALSATYTIDSAMLRDINLYLSAEQTYLDKWKAITDKTYAKGGLVIKIEGVAGELKKDVTFGGKTFEVTVDDSGSISVAKPDGSDTYTLSKSGKRTLVISSVNNTNVAGLVSFVITY